MQVVMPLDLGKMIPEEDSVRLLIEVTERMDYSQLNQAYIRKQSKDEATPKQLFQIVMLGYMKGRRHSREIEEACRCDIRFMYLLKGKRVPDHSRIARFIRHRLYGEVMENLFYQFVFILREMGEVGFENLFVDGTKIEAYANRYTFVWKKAVEKHAVRLEEKIAALVEEIKAAHPFETVHLCTAEEVLDCLNKLCITKEIRFVHGSGKRKTPLQRYVETLGAMLEKREEYEHHKEICGQRNSYSKTDTDATFMRMKEDHMGNGQLKPAYNVQLGVEAQYIVAVDISQERNDAHTLIPLLKRMQAHNCPIPKNTIDDAGYESEENYAKLEEMGCTAYIKPQNYEKSKKRSFRKNAFLRENMPYDKDTDSYTCPAGKRLIHTGETVRHSKSGYEHKLSVYTACDCVGCPMKQNCTKAKENRKLTVSKAFDAYRQASLERITSEKGILLRMNRSIQSEGTFGVLKEDWHFRRFLRRGSAHVMTELLIYAFAFNVEKLQNKMLSGRLLTPLFLPSSA